MPKPVLSAEEIAALTAADHSPAGDRFAPSSTGDRRPTSPPHPVDRPFGPASPGWLAVEALLESTVREFARVLAPLVKDAVELVEHGFQEPVPSRPRSGRIACEARLEGAGFPPGAIVLLADRALLAPVFGRLLGGRTPLDLPPDRPLSAVEERLASRVAGMFFDTLTRQFGQPWQCSLARLGEASAILPAVDRPTSLRAELWLGSIRGQLEVVLPWQTARDVSAALLAKSSPGMPSAPADSESSGAAPGQSLIVASLPLVELDLPPDVQLEAGDVLDTELPADTAVQISVDGKVRFEAAPIACEGKFAVEIERARDED